VPVWCFRTCAIGPTLILRLALSARSLTPWQSRLAIEVFRAQANLQHGPFFLPGHPQAIISRNWAWLARPFWCAYLFSSRPARPPSGPEISLMWTLKQYSIKQSVHSQSTQGPATSAHDTVHQLRSVVSKGGTWRLLISDPKLLLLDSERLLLQDYRFTDAAGSTLFTTGMGPRLRTDSTPALALLDRHTRALDQGLDCRYRACTTAADRCELAHAGLRQSFLVPWLVPVQRDHYCTVGWYRCRRPL
jgi:hypothetical protein